MTPAIGQFIPGNSILHKADPRTKLVVTILFMVSIMFIDSFLGYGIAAVFLLVSIISSRIPFTYILRSIRGLIYIVVFTVVLNILFHTGENLIWEWGIFHIYREGIIFAVKMVFRILLLVVGASLLTFTTSSIAITDGMESLMKPLSKIHFPSHEIAMMMSIALRFIPTFSEETDRIMKAQTSRGADFENGNLIEKVECFIPVIIPLIISAFRRAEDLATAMEARCYTGGTNRTRYRQLKFSWRDIVVFLIVIIFFVAILVFKL